MSNVKEKFPFIDISEELAECMGIYALNSELFDTYHTSVEANLRFFRYGHAALRSGGAAALDDTELAGAVSLGAQTYEVVGGALASDVTTTEAGHQIAYESTRRFLDPTNLKQFRERGQMQSERMRHDMPILHAAIEEIASRHLGHDRQATDYAIVGAAMLQGMHMRTERLAAA